MSKKVTSTKRKAPDPLLGTWCSVDEYGTGLEFTIRKTGDSYTVRAVDTHDKEEADIFETAWDGTTLTFATHWNSTGRFARYRFLLLSPNQVSLTYTYTDKEIFQRKRNA